MKIFYIIAFHHNLITRLEEVPRVRLGNSNIKPRTTILEYIDQSNYDSNFESTENYLLGLGTMRSHVLQEPFERCRSVKVKRVFLYLSEKLAMPYFRILDLSRIDIGKGKRVIVKNGRLNTKYQITVERLEEERAGAAFEPAAFGL